MTLDSNALAQQIYEQARQLPAESLEGLAQYVEFLMYKSGDRDRKIDVEPVDKSLLIVKLGGILEGYDIDVSPEKLAEVRRVMSLKFEDIEK